MMSSTTLRGPGWTIRAKSSSRPKAVSHVGRRLQEFHQLIIPPHPFRCVTGLKGEADRLAAQKGKGFCGSCYGGEPPAGGCCNTCEEVREAYARKGWSFSDPDHIDQVSMSATGSRYTDTSIRLIISTVVAVASASRKDGQPRCRHKISRDAESLAKST